MLCIASKNLVNIWLLCFKNLIHERALIPGGCSLRLYSYCSHVVPDQGITLLPARLRIFCWHKRAPTARGAEVQ